MAELHNRNTHVMLQFPRSVLYLYLSECAVCGLCDLSLNTFLRSFFTTVYSTGSRLCVRSRNPHAISGIMTSVLTFQKQEPNKRVVPENIQIPTTEEISLRTPNLHGFSINFLQGGALHDDTKSGCEAD